MAPFIFYQHTTVGSIGSEQKKSDTGEGHDPIPCQPRDERKYNTVSRRLISIDSRSGGPA